MVGFDMVFVADDLMLKPVWPLLTLIAEHTKRVGVGTSIVHPFLRHPALLAGSIAEIDELSNKRAILGIGKGAFYEFLGMAPEKPITAVREAIEIINRLLAGDRTPYHGKVFTATEEAFLRWTPVRKRIPISIGAWGPKMCQLAGEMATELKAFGLWNPDYIALVKENVAIGAARAGRRPQEVVICSGSVCSVSMDRRAAMKAARQSLAIFLPWLAPMTDAAGIDPAVVRSVREANRHGAFTEAAKHITDDMVSYFGVAGRPEDVIPQIEKLIGLGIRHISFGPPLGPDREEAIKLLGRKVLPYFKG